jgi:hypothetical protein
MPAKKYKVAPIGLPRLAQNLYGVGEIAVNKTKTFLNNQKSKSNIKKLSDIQGERNFFKNNPGLADKTGNFPKAGPDMPRSYNKKAGAEYNKALDENMKKFGFKK